ncbi:MAG: hypothetical protein ABSF29_06060 [Tepidisphaeraceae bacterium]|jgi:hypothetical protein
MEVVLSAGAFHRPTLVFILSENRSGSQWLAYVLGSHRGAAYLGEYRRWFTKPDRTFCNLCAARHAPDCEILSGIRQIPRDRAFDFAFDRLGRSILIDSSKRLDWAAHFVNDPRYQVRIVHLLRDPRGWFASERRRTPFSASAAARRWVRTNCQISEFIASRRLDATSVFYDDLAVDPEQHFSPLCDFLGFRHEPAALEYWSTDHHGPGGNGPALNVTGESNSANITTGDDAFYLAAFRRSFYDTRWLAQLSPRDRDAIERSPMIQRLLTRYRRDFAHFDGLLAAADATATADCNQT